MELNRQISRRLHEEHEATLALWSRVEASLAANRPDAGLLKSAAAALAEELERHFAFEEQELFPRLAAAGEADIGLLLADEHATIRDVGHQFIALVKSEPGNARLRPLGLEKIPYGPLVGQVQLATRPQNEVHGIALQAPHQGRTDQTAVSSDKYFHRRRYSECRWVRNPSRAMTASRRAIPRSDATISRTRS